MSKKHGIFNIGVHFLFSKVFWGALLLFIVGAGFITGLLTGMLL